MVEGRAFVLSKKLAHVFASLYQWAKCSLGSIKLKKLALLNEVELLDIVKESRMLSAKEIRVEQELSKKQEENTRFRNKRKFIGNNARDCNGYKKGMKIRSFFMRLPMAEGIVILFPLLIRTALRLWIPGISGNIS